MELLFVVLGGALLGVAARYALPRRHTYGSVLVPAIGAGVAAVVWVALTWLGWAWDGGWIWVVSLVAAGLASAASAFVVGLAASVTTRPSSSGSHDRAPAARPEPRAHRRQAVSPSASMRRV